MVRSPSAKKAKATNNLHASAPVRCHLLFGPQRETPKQPHGFALQVDRSNGPQGSTRTSQGQARRTRREKGERRREERRESCFEPQPHLGETSLQSACSTKPQSDHPLLKAKATNNLRASTPARCPLLFGPHNARRGGAEATSSCHWHPWEPSTTHSEQPRLREGRPQPGRSWKERAVGRRGSRGRQRWARRPQRGSNGAWAFCFTTSTPRRRPTNKSERCVPK